MPLFDGPLENRPVDPSEEFNKQHNHFFTAQKLAGFDPRSASGKVRWEGFSLEQRVSYHQVTLPFADQKAWKDAPPSEYEDVQDFPFSVSFVTPQTVRLRLAACPREILEEGSLMLDGEPPTDDPSWEQTDDGSCTTYAGPFGSLEVERDPFHLWFRDASGNILTRTQHPSDARGELNSLPVPFSFVRRSYNLHRHLAATFTLAPDERLFGGGESFTRLDKRGQRMVLWTCDAYGAQTPYMYKPIPFFMSSRGYGMFVHTSAPLTFDLGRSYDGAATIFLGDDLLDLFFFFGSPKEILSEYTALTGRAPTPPLWTFGLWMGRNSYYSEEETRAVAKKLRENRIPSDVIHLDTGWFEVPSRCDFEFSTSRFEDPEKMFSDLKEDGFRVSLWQLPYLNPKNDLHAEVTERGYAVPSASGRPPVDDAVLDLSAPEAVGWYKGKLAGLLRMGASIFTADFGEAAPLSGLYHSGWASFLEHNLYPLRYNKAVSEVTEDVSAHGTIYARSAWAGSQRYPVHWAGDAETTDAAMAATLRGGLSLGLCGFSFWSHFIGGFPYPTPPDLYLRWLAFGVLTSHSRCHGMPPTEPWEYGEGFTEEFRRIVQMRYRLMPYVFAQARLASEMGYPMLRALFFEHPEDPTCWTVDDEYMFGEDVLVAPLMEEARSRNVYLPPGSWVDYQGGQSYEGSRWHTLTAGEIPVIMLVRGGAVIPHAELAQSTDRINFSELELVAFGAQAPAAEAEALVCFPEEGELHRLRLKGDSDAFVVEGDPLPEGVTFRIVHFA
jgi:alpha-D-xyloside xylohydrolase